MFHLVRALSDSEIDFSSFAAGKAGGAGIISAAILYDLAGAA
jgi:hypothetical protein